MSNEESFESSITSKLEVIHTAIAKLGKKHDSVHWTKIVEMIAAVVTTLGAFFILFVSQSFTAEIEQSKTRAEAVIERTKLQSELAQGYLQVLATSGDEPKRRQAILIIGSVIGPDETGVFARLFPSLGVERGLEDLGHAYRTSPVPTHKTIAEKFYLTALTVIPLYSPKDANDVHARVLFNLAQLYEGMSQIPAANKRYAEMLTLGLGPYTHERLVYLTRYREFLNKYNLASPRGLDVSIATLKQNEARCEPASQQDRRSSQ
jgi:hypothetical protein